MSHETTIGSAAETDCFPDVAAIFHGFTVNSVGLYCGKSIKEYFSRKYGETLFSLVGKGKLKNKKQNKMTKSKETFRSVRKRLSLWYLGKDRAHVCCVETNCRCNVCPRHT